LLKQIQELESNICNKHEEEEVKEEFKNRDELRMSMMNWNEFEDDFEDYDDATEEDQMQIIEKLEKEVQKRTVELEDTEKENLDSKLVMMNEYKEQMKMIDFFKEIIFSQISKGELEQLRIQSKWSDKDNEFKVPVFYAKNGKVNALKLPKHEIMIKLSELYDSRSLKLKTDSLVKEVDMSIDEGESDVVSTNDSLFKNQKIDASFYKSKSDLIDSKNQKDYPNPSLLKDKVLNRPKKHRLPPVNP